MQQHINQRLKLVHYVAFGILALMVACTVAFGIIPMRRKGNDDIRAAADLRDSLARLEQLRLANARAQVQIQDAEKRLHDAEKHLASGPPDNAFNRELSQIAKDSGIRIENMPPVRDTKDIGSYKTAQVTVVGTGDWEACYRFLAGLRTMDRILRLDTVVLDVEDKDAKALAAGKGLCQLTVKFSTFYMER